MRTFVREASMLDCLGVFSRLGTDRGQTEIAQAQNIAGPYTPEKLAIMHYGASATTVAFCSMAEPGRALAVAGFIRERAGVLRTWMFATDEAWEDYGTELTMETLKGIEVALETAHRIEAICSDSRPQVHRWYARIGLTKETTLRRYMADGSDAALFVRIRSDQ